MRRVVVCQRPIRNQYPSVIPHATSEAHTAIIHSYLLSELVPTVPCVRYKTITRTPRSPRSGLPSTLRVNQPRQCLPLVVLATPTLPRLPQSSSGWSMLRTLGTALARSSTVSISFVTQPNNNGHSCPSRPGMTIVLYFQTVAVLVSPANRKGKTVKWGLVGYSTVMFGLVTTFTAMNVRLQQLAYIDNREFPGIANTIPPGPMGWALLMYSKPLVIVPNACFITANWLADGLLVSTSTLGGNVAD